MFFKQNTYCSRDEKATKEVPHPVKCSRNNQTEMVTWRGSDPHHAIVGKVEESEVHEEEKPKNLSKRPFKCHHCIYYDAIYQRL